MAKLAPTVESDFCFLLVVPAQAGIQRRCSRSSFPHAFGGNPMTWPLLVIPAQAGIQLLLLLLAYWQQRLPLALWASGLLSLLAQRK
jgi:hypothetical protein